MKLLVADDDVLFRGLLKGALTSAHDIVMTEDGTEAWAALQRKDAPTLAILDWVMPGFSGPQLPK